MNTAAAPTPAFVPCLLQRHEHGSPNGGWRGSTAVGGGADGKLDRYQGCLAGQHQPSHRQRWKVSLGCAWMGWAVARWWLWQVSLGCAWMGWAPSGLTVAKEPRAFTSAPTFPSSAALSTPPLQEGGSTLGELSTGCWGFPAMQQNQQSRPSLFQVRHRELYESTVQRSLYRSANPTMPPLLVQLRPYSRCPTRGGGTTRGVSHSLKMFSTLISEIAPTVGAHTTPAAACCMRASHRGATSPAT